MTMSITGGEFFATRELRWLTSARAGNVHSLITRDQLAGTPPDQRQLMTGITVIDIREQRWLVCTDTHRLHALRTKQINGNGRPEPGHYQPTPQQNRYQRTEQLFLPDQLRRLVRQSLDPHVSRPLKLQLSGVKPKLAQYARAGVVIVCHARNNGVDVHDRRTGKRIDSIAGCPLMDRHRQVKQISIELSVLWPTLTNGRITTLTSAGPMQPFVGETSEHLALVMPTSQQLLARLCAAA